MASRKTPLGEMAEQACRDFPQTASRTLARRISLASGKAYSIDQARTAVRYARGTAGEKRRKHKTVERASKPSLAPACPPSAAEPWLPIQIDGPCRVLILSDIHVPYHSVEAVEAAVEFGRKLKPDVVLLNGDTLDFYQCSRYQKDPGKRTLKEELATGKEMLVWLRKMFRKSRFIFKLGNHDERWDHFIWNRAAEMFDVENVQLHNMLEFEKLGIERVGSNIIMCGKLAVLHGHEFGKSGIAAPVNPARGAFLRTNHTVLIGHLHRPSSHAESDMFQSETMTWSTGCLCDRRPEYARINKWGWGFAHVEVDKDNQFNVHNYRLSNDYRVRTA